MYATGLWTGLLVLVYRSRPDLDTADPAASLLGYRKALGAFGRAGLILLACVDASLLLVALQLWQVLHLSGGANVLVVLPGRGRPGRPSSSLWWPPGGHGRDPPPQGRATDRDDDRYWKGGIVYVNRDDPAVLVSARVAFGWTVNLGNPTAWLLVVGFRRRASRLGDHQARHRPLTPARPATGHPSQGGGWKPERAQSAGHFSGIRGSVVL